jgi:hypothetical protein
MLVAGIVLAPGYTVWCVYYSGDVVLEMPLQRVAGGRDFAPVQLHLTPAMQPVRLNLTTSLLLAPTATPSAANRYRARVEHGAEVLIDEQVVLAPRQSRDLGIDAQSVAIGRLEPEIEADYLFRLIETEPSAWPISAITLQVRRNAREPVPAVLGAGIALILVALFQLFVRRRS